MGNNNIQNIAVVSAALLAASQVHFLVVCQADITMDDPKLVSWHMELALPLLQSPSLGLPAEYVTQLNGKHLCLYTACHIRLHDAV